MSHGRGCSALCGGSESLGTSATPEAAATTDVTVGFAGLGTEFKGLLELPAHAPASDELRQNLDERRAVDLAERNAQLAGPAAEGAKVKKRPEYAALANEHYSPWWRRLARWIQTRRGRAARKRLRERL
jgi:hypothetical protein